MSVINRMLADLERRGSPGARHLGVAGSSPGPRADRSRVRRLLARLGPVLLLAALVVVAAALWQRQWPEIRQWAMANTASARTESGAGQSSSESALPRVTDLRFERDDGATRLVVAFDAPLSEAPGYGRNGDRLGLRMPANWDAAPLPSPPADQSVFREVTLAARDDASTRIAIAVDPAARFDLDHRDRELVLTGRVPEPSPESTATDRAATGDTGEAQTDGDGADNAERVAAADTAGTGTGDEETAVESSDRGGNGEASATKTAEQAPEADGEKTSEPQKSVENGDNESNRVADDAAGSDPEAATRDATSGDAASGETEDGSEGSVRKSEPDVGPTERARRLESAAREALDNGNVATARQKLVEALDHDPARHSARDLLVALALRAGDAAAARDLLVEGVARAPRRTAYVKPFARLLVDAGELERAYTLLERAAPAAANDAGYHGLMAAVAQRLDRHEAAASAYTRALELDDSRGVWWMGLGIALRRTDHPDEALAAFREARASGDLNDRLNQWVQQRIDALSDSAR